MKKTTVISSLVLLSFLVMAVMFTFVSTVSANTISLSDPGNRYSNGGPFTALVHKTVPDGLVGTPISGGIDFTTFCLEKTEYFSWNTPYDYTIAEFASGGAGGNVNGQDYLDPKSAWLYYNFRTNSSFADTIDKVKALQVAFWLIEDEMVLTSTPASGSVEAQAESYINEATGKWSNIGPVVVLNLVDGNNKNLQSQLGLTAVPEPTTLLLLGLGLLGLGVSSKKFKK